MTNEVTKKPENEVFDLDGFSGFTDEFEGGDQDERTIEGMKIKFTNEAVWVDAAEEPLPSELELIVAKVKRYAVKWGNKEGPPLENKLIPDGQKFPDLKAWNEKCPKHEWRERFGQLLGPWEAQHIIYMWDPATMNKYTWPTSTIGGHICVADIVEKTCMKRSLQKVQCYAVVKLRSMLMSKKYNRQRPHLVVLRWVTLGGGEVLTMADTPAIGGPASQQSMPGMKVVTPPTGREAVDDEIPF
jgi:hypothetical protein